MEPGGSINQIRRIYISFFKIHHNIVFYLHLGLPRDLFPVGFPVTVLKALLPSSILVTCPTHLNFLHLIILRGPV